MDWEELAQLMLCIGPEDHIGNPLDVDEQELSRVAMKLLAQSGFCLCKKNVSFKFKYGRRPLCIMEVESRPAFVVKFGAGYFGDVSAEYRTLEEVYSVSKAAPSLLRVPVPLGISVSENAFLYKHIEGERYSDLLQTEIDSDVAVLARLGRSIAVIHGLNCSNGENQLQDLPHMLPPWSNFSSVQVSVAQYARGVGEDFHTFLSLVQDSAGLFGSLSGEWEDSSVIHGDLRFDNVIVAEDCEPVLIDWELAAWGDRRYDIGYVIADCIFASACEEQDEINEKWFDRTKAFLRGYYSHLAIDGIAVDRDLNYAFDMAALALLHKLSSLLQHRGQLGRVGYKMLLIIKNILSSSSVISAEMEKAL